MDKNARINNLIKSLILSFKDYDNTLKNRFKADSIILGLEENVEKNLNKLINLSDSRYKFSKYGVKLDKILNRQKTNYENLSKMISKDKIYSSNILDLEKAKLFKSSVSIKNKKIFDIRDKLFNTLRSTKNKIKNSIENKSNNSKKINEEEKFPKLEINIVNNNNSPPSSIRKSLKFYSNKKNILSRKGTLSNNNNNNKNEGQKFVDNLIMKDYNKFFTTIDSYHSFLGKLKNLSSEKFKGKRIKISRDNFEQFQTNLNCLEFLTYKENNSQSKAQNIIKKDFEFDLKKIQKIKIKHDRNNKLKYKLLNYNKKENSPSIISKNSHNKSCGCLSIDLITDSKNNNLDNNDNNNCIEKKDNLSDKKNTIFDGITEKKNYNYKNTANIVLNEAENGLFYSQNFINKRKKFNNYFNKCFQISNSKKNKKIINESKSKNELKQKYNKKNSIIDQNEIYEYRLKKRHNIRKDFQDIYEKKKLEWKEEDKLKELKKLKENQKQKEIDYFLLNSHNK